MAVLTPSSYAGTITSSCKPASLVSLLIQIQSNDPLSKRHVEGERTQKELKKEYRKFCCCFSKLKYKDKVEINLFVGNAKDAWKGLNTMMGRNQQQKPLTSVDLSALANDLNRFYARFDTQDFSDECNTLCQSLISCPVNVDEGDVVKCLSRINPRKVPGSDGLRGRVLKVCAEHLGRVFTHMFQLYLGDPVRKKWMILDLLHQYRSIIAWKELFVISWLHLWLIAWTRCSLLTGLGGGGGRRVEDATLTLFDLISNHLDSPGTTVRVLCMDFSSAFNTIQPHVLIKKKKKKKKKALGSWGKHGSCSVDQSVSTRSATVCLSELTSVWPACAVRGTWF